MLIGLCAAWHSSVAGSIPLFSSGFSWQPERNGKELLLNATDTQVDGANGAVLEYEFADLTFPAKWVGIQANHVEIEQGENSLSFRYKSDQPFVLKIRLVDAAKQAFELFVPYDSAGAWVEKEIPIESKSFSVPNQQITFPIKSIWMGVWFKEGYPAKGKVILTEIPPKPQGDKPAHAVWKAPWKKEIPMPVFDENPGFVDLYWKTWQFAHSHVRKDSGLPQSPYIDEALWDDTIWIWDTCFMSLFCRYAPGEFPGVESLNNFYVPLHDSTYPEGTYPLNIQHPDNPPLFSWAEYCNFTVLGNKDHVRKLITQTQYLQKHFEWFDTVKPGWRFQPVSTVRQSIPVKLEKKEDGYLWGGVQNGMDNTPRKGGLWLDALAQQGLSALYISRLAEVVGEDAIAKQWRATYEGIKKKVNDLYWDEEDGIYYDIDPESKAHLKVKTPASYWPMLAEMCSPAQAERMVKHLKDPQIFGGDRPWVTVARNDPAFTEPDGNYWRGAVWLPTAYMGTKALEKYGYYAEADAAAEKLLSQMLRTYHTYEPHTIWECYSPTRDFPANHGGDRVREDFCGWSALGPISLFIENVLGFHVVDGNAKRIEWRLHQTGRHGIENLRFGGITTDIIYDGKSTVTVRSTAPYTLVVNGESHAIPDGSSSFAIPMNPKKQL